jgi:ABC-type sulfate/molybdate transport systems ATPase subunit
MFDRIIFMENGSIKWIGPPNEITNQPFYDEFSKLLKSKDYKENNNNINNK